MVFIPHIKKFLSLFLVRIENIQQGSDGPRFKGQTIGYRGNFYSHLALRCESLDPIRKPPLRGRKLAQSLVKQLEKQLFLRKTRSGRNPTSLIQIKILKFFDGGAFPFKD